jgi:pantothenate kinase
MKYDVNINGIDVAASFSEEDIRDVYEPLLRRLAEIRREKGSRVLAMIAAPPGAGKSTLASFLEYYAKALLPDLTVQAIGMDGFHRRQEYLLSHTTVRDGQEVRMVDIKGAPVTFDLDLFTERIRRLFKEEKVFWPSYDRHLHNPVEDAILVERKIVFLEGNYLLLEEDGWRNLKEMADYTVFITADEYVLRDRLVDRKFKSGNEREVAEKFVDYSDMANVRLCLSKSSKADLTLFVDKIEMRIAK